MRLKVIVSQIIHVFFQEEIKNKRSLKWKKILAQLYQEQVDGRKSEDKVDPEEVKDRREKETVPIVPAAKMQNAKM